VSEGRLAAAPFNASTAMLWINQDALGGAGLDPETAPRTWRELTTVAGALRDKGGTRVAMTSAWPIWIQFEQFAALHDLPFATRNNGFDGLDAELLINAQPFVRHLDRLVGLAREGSFTYAGRDAAADRLFPAGEAAISFASSGLRGTIVRDARFRWKEAVLPYDSDLIEAPRSAIVGGASLWAMTAPDRKPAEYRATAQFLGWLASADNVANWSQRTGYVPVTEAGFALSRRQGYYERNPGADLAVLQLARIPPGATARGIRLGRMPELRTIISEEIEAAFQGRQNAQAALDAAVARGNRVLRDFERSVRG
jgi:sn-glycerol 3-phosphate transport system substrate-binding protein